MYRPSDLHKMLKQLGVEPKKSLSQNFLIDGNIIRKIVHAAGVQKGDVVLEIGPGPGALTQEILKRGADVIAVEKDRILAEHLMRLEGKLTVYSDDILKFDFSKKLDPHLKNKKAKVIANLPYHITTPIITKLIEMHDRFDTIVIMVQHEVAKRMSASPGNKDYGSLTIFLNFHSVVDYTFKVKNTCFYPVPKVDSGVVKLDLKTPPFVSNPDKYQRIVRKSFEQRRKMLRKSLSDSYSSQDITTSLERLNLNPKARPEELSLDDFIRLFEELEKSSS